VRSQVRMPLALYGKKTRTEAKKRKILGMSK
jgi:hypothetical protein